MDNRLPQNKKAIVWLCGGHFINDIYTGVLNPIMPFIAAKIGITMAIATIILTVSHIFSSLLQPLFGYFADNIVKRSFIFWGLITRRFADRKETLNISFIWRMITENRLP